MNPGAWKRSRERRGRFEDLLARLQGETVLAIADRRVLRLHPSAARALKAKEGVRLIQLVAGESAKSVDILERLAVAAAPLSRSLTVLAIGGGTIGDVATVFAHLFKRGVGRLIHVPTTLLAAVDSSVGGKGAVNVAGAKNMLGVFHAADETWLCPHFFDTLSEAQIREGQIEALKMVVTLDAREWTLWRRQLPTRDRLVAVARRLKNAIVDRDPYDTTGERMVLNFGHTMGHVLESVSHYGVRHGEAVGLGMLYALDLGVRLGVTPESLAREVEAVLPVRRSRLVAWLRRAGPARINRLLAFDKKQAWLLLVAPGKTTLWSMERD